MKATNLIGEEFQTKSAHIIYERLFGNQATGSRRMLLADEVGLGKTVVTINLIDEFFKHSNKNVLYISSNIEIGAQNLTSMGKHLKSEMIIPGGRLSSILLAGRDWKYKIRSRRPVYPV